MKVYYVDGVFRRTFYATRKEAKDAALKQSNEMQLVNGEAYVAADCTVHEVDAVAMLDGFETRVLILRRENAKLSERIEQLEKKIGGTKNAGE